MIGEGYEFIDLYYFKTNLFVPSFFIPIS